MLVITDGKLLTHGVLIQTKLQILKEPFSVKSKDAAKGILKEIRKKSPNYIIETIG